MIYVFTGPNRTAVAKEIEKVLGSDYEVFEGGELGLQELMNIFQGMSLLSSKRRILIKDLTPAPRRGEDATEDGEAAAIDYYGEMKNYVNTPHTIVIWETTKSQKKSFKDFVKLAGVKFQNFNEPKKVNATQVFGILDMAYRNGAAAVAELKKVKENNDPYMFFGLLASQAIKKYEFSQSVREKRVLKELSRLDMQMKTSRIEPWILVESFLARLSSL